MGPFIKKIIGIVEEHPDYEFVYNYTVTQNFANEIKRVVNDFYGRSAQGIKSNALRNGTLTVAAVLMESEDIGPWVPDHALYNCYIYSIGIPERIFVDPGWFSNSPFSLSLPINEMAEIVVNDLRVLGAERVYADGTMTTDNLCTFEQIICIRKGLEDYHLMRYSFGSWYHKPGQYAVMRYRYTPSLVRLWTNEALGPEGVVPANTVYDSGIQYISFNGHDWEYTSNSNGTHTKYCEICDDLITENCDLEYSNINNFYHKGTCADCGYTTANTPCSYTYTYLGGKLHKATCTVCGHSVNMQCNMTSTYESNGQHRSQCAQCQGALYEACSGTAVYCGSGTVHQYSTGCQTCGNIIGGGPQPCSFVYQFHGTVNGSNMHRQVCSTCSFAKDPTLCFIKNGKCTYCGTSSDVVMNPNKLGNDVLE